MSQGGGFYATQSSPYGGSPGGGSLERSELSNSVRPLTIAQFGKATQAHTDAPWTVDEMEIGQVTLVAHVVNINRQATNCQYTLEDGTGSMEARHWLEGSEEDNRKWGNIEENTYARVTGNLKAFNARRYLNATNISPIEDPHELYYHLLETVYVTMMLKHGPPVSGGQPGQITSGSGSGSMSAYTAQPAQQVDENPDWASLPKLQRQIVNIISAQPENDEGGVHVSAIAKALNGQNVQAHEISDALDHLMDMGHVYTTCDDQHFQNKLKKARHIGALPGFSLQMSKALQVSVNWPGFSGIKKLMIFGDSYSSVGYTGSEQSCPSASNPLGVPYPGAPRSMWNEPKTPNWVGHLITKYVSEPRFDPKTKQQAEEYCNAPLLVYDYAVGGQTVSGVVCQIEAQFLPGVGKKPEWALWTASESLFVTWVGINDCGYHRDTSEETMSSLFESQEKLYQAGARNFMFIDVPPIHRCPAVSKRRETEASEAYLNWNTALQKSLDIFTKSHSDVTLLLFSSFEVFSAILDNPVSYGFQASQIRERFGEIWSDDLHPTSKVHDILATRLADFLNTVST
ncbi:hypothetical protein D9758_000632 [Tetrapyrgos nigripes]|uniref:Replication protein A C-terminal domain-containing protein n=1 Tax=Tetrapyrgos nigripes TaxID=182062 RepID=A0A8H5GZL5_9AGAR|nr:hypothetical protein D9758_000632 [Tetrapyrgos nigripes]